MMKKMQAVIAACVVAGSVILIGITVHLAFLFPKTVAVWADQGKQLSVLEQFMANFSNLAKVFGLPILGLLMLVTVASLVWLAVSIAGKQKESANTASHGTLANSRP